MPDVRKVQVVEYEYEPEGQLPLLTLEEVGLQRPISFERMIVPTFSDEFLLTEDSSTTSYRHALDPAPEIDEVLFEAVIEKIPDMMSGWLQNVKQKATLFESSPSTVQPLGRGKSKTAITLEPCVRCGALLEAKKGHVCPRAPKTDVSVRTQIENSAKFISEVTNKREALARAEALGQLTSILARWPTSKIVQLTGIAIILNTTPRTVTVGPPCSSIQLPPVPSFVSLPMPLKFPAKCKICKCTTLDTPTN